MAVLVEFSDEYDVRSVRLTTKGIRVTFFAPYHEHDRLLERLQVCVQKRISDAYAVVNGVNNVS